MDETPAYDGAVAAALAGDRPSAEATAAGRDRLLALAAAEPSRGRVLGLGPGLGLGAAAAVAAVTLAGGAAVPGDGPRTATPDARTVLLAAAERAAAEPSGRYWHVRSVEGTGFRIGGPGGYNVLDRKQVDDWRAPSLDTADVVYQRDLGARPARPADAAAWRKAGSPTRFPLGRGAALSTVPGQGLLPHQAGWRKLTVRPAAKRIQDEAARRTCARWGELGQCGQNPGTAARVARDPALLKRLVENGDGGMPPAGLENGYTFLTDAPSRPPRARRSSACWPGCAASGRSARSPTRRAGPASAWCSTWSPRRRTGRASPTTSTWCWNRGPTASSPATPSWRGAVPAPGRWGSSQVTSSGRPSSSTTGGPAPPRTAPDARAGCFRGARPLARGPCSGYGACTGGGTSGGAA
ncbi:hypothetical protein [Actinomadura parmotrematis]|uniref:Uncharacterized protein n=1 Tax=Actinomadura parmotrematis TaxID=2864039 RepID=A0ABS7FPN0_9ACTN|nr:hypothetical protein [Actinomadura parmotrematis]MBW8481950.1 hypothetical protein [Actinomadura parmotrematis]